MLGAAGAAFPEGAPVCSSKDHERRSVDWERPLVDAVNPTHAVPSASESVLAMSRSSWSVTTVSSM